MKDNVDYNYCHQRWWRKKMEVTRKCLLLFLLSFTFVVAFAQQKVNLDVKDQPLLKVLNLLQEQSDYTFLFTASDVENVRGISMKAVNEELLDVLRKCLRGTNLTFEVSDKLIVLKQLPPAKDSVRVKSLTVKGRIYDVKKQPIPGVTVLVKGTTIGVTTDVDGKFTLSVPSEEAEVVFSFVGMKTITLKCNERPKQGDWVITMEDDVIAMDEVNVVTTGYQTVNRRDMVGSFSQVKVEDIMIPAYSTIDQMLQGQIPGMLVMNTSARAGASPKIQIRGTSTLLGNQDPIWVVDGIIQDDPISLNAASNLAQDMREIIGNQVSWLNPNDIETITVLKDASATAIYGSRASNGVIVITTKKGKMGRISVNYSGNLSIAPRPRYSRFKMMNSQERVQFSEDAFAAGMAYVQEPFEQYNTYEGVLRMYQNGKISADEFVQRRNYLETINTDWLKLLTRTSITHNHNVSVSGASEKVNYSLSLGYNNTEGQEIGNSSERLTARTAVTINLRKNIRLNLTLNGSTGTNKGFAGTNPMNYALNTSRAIPVYEENGDYAYYREENTYAYNTEAKAQGVGFNILNELENSGSEVKNSSIKVSLDFSWQILDWLTYQFTGGYSYGNTNTSSWQGERTTAIAEKYRGYDYGSISAENPWFKAALLPFGGILATNSSITNSYNMQNKLLFSKTFNGIHRLNAMVAMELRSTTTDGDSYTRYGYVPDRGNLFVRPTTPEDFQPIGTGTFNGFGVFERLYSGESTVSEKTDNFLSYFATLAYSLNNKYVFNFNVRNDISNRFGQDVNKRFDPTYSFGASWRMTEEPFMQNQRILTNVNLKATWGIQGNALTNLSPELILTQQGVMNIYNEYYSRIFSIPNSNLSWERTHSWNFGVDLQFFGKINANVDYYIRRSNAILDREIPLENGMATMDINGGIIYNSGIEFTVSFTPVNSDVFGINMSINSSKNWNSAGKEGIDDDPTLNDYLSGRSDMLVRKGYALGSMWSYDFKGLNPENGYPTYNLVDIPEEEYNGDITSFLKFSGQKDPYFTGGLNLNIRYRSFNLGTSFSVLLGGITRLESPSADMTNGQYMPNPQDNLTTDLLKRWKKPGDEKYTDIPGFIIGNKGASITLPNQTTVNIMKMYAQSDALTVSSSFLRCRGLDFSWTMNRDLLKKIGISNFRLTASVTNLFVIASKRFNGYDPELQNSVMPKNFSIGINVGF